MSEPWKLEKDMCRCCHSEGSFHNLLEPRHILGQTEYYLEMLRQSFNIELEPVPGIINELTFTICDTCITRLRDAFNFKQQVLLCEKRFKEVYKDILKELTPSDQSTNVNKLEVPNFQAKFETPITFQDTHSNRPCGENTVETTSKPKSSILREQLFEGSCSESQQVPYEQPSMQHQQQSLTHLLTNQDVTDDNRVYTLANGQRISSTDLKHIREQTMRMPMQKQHRKTARNTHTITCKEQQRPVQRVPPMQTQQVPQHEMPETPGATPQPAAHPQSAKMLIFLQNGEQRLITFTLPRQSCTLQEVLEQVNIPFSDDTHIQCMQNTGSEIDYFVSVGSTRAIEEMLENHPMLVGDMSRRRSPRVMARAHHSRAVASATSTYRVRVRRLRPRPPLRTITRMHASDTA